MNNRIDSGLPAFSNKKPTVVSVFSGCGGLDLGFAQAGFDVVYAADNDPDAIRVYKHNLDPRAFVRDATSEQFHSEIAEMVYGSIAELEMGDRIEAERITTSDRSDDRQSTAGNKNEKTRAYDFVLPFKVPGWQQHLFIQSQFYAGDAGSVSHKNVDQTDASRAKAVMFKEQRKEQMPLFLEYVDGAGYAASLNRDLRSLLDKSNTHGFFQIRSAPIRLRREFQYIGFLTPMEVEHAVIRAKGLGAKAKRILQKEGYDDVEINRVFMLTLESRRLIETDNGLLRVSDQSIVTTRRYLLLDHIATLAQEIMEPASAKGVVFVPGFGPRFGTNLDHLGSQIEKEAPGVWSLSILSADLRWLAQMGFVKLR